MVVTWIVAVGLIVFAQLATRHDEAGARRRAELARVAGREPLQLSRRHHRPRTWSSGRSGSSRRSSSSSSRPTGSASFPGVGSIGWGHQTAERLPSSISRCFRGANADVNLTLAMALVFFACWIVWALQEVGVGGLPQGAVRAEGREHRRAEGAAGRRVLRRRLPRGRSRSCSGRCR